MSLIVNHWGTYRTRVEGGELKALDPVPWDSNPSPIGRSIPKGIISPSRVRSPAVRAGFLKGRGASRDQRGSEPFVEVSWEEAIALVAEEVARVKDAHGNSAIYGGSYGWSSAGRFHHAQSQVHRFLNAFGGYTYSVDTYSSGAARRVLPHVIGDEMDIVKRNHTTWSMLARHCKLFVAFGGLPTKNSQVSPGGANDHVVSGWLRKLAAAGVKFINVSPLRHDLDDVPATWLPVRPGSDTALILALCHTLIVESLVDKTFIETYTAGYDRFKAYVLGDFDGIPKSPAWAAALTDIPAETTLALAREMQRVQTMVNITWSLQRAIQGEQPYWALVSLGALLGQIGTEGGGVGFGYSCGNDVGSGRNDFSGPRLPQGTNPVDSYIPVACVSEMLLNPGAPFDYNGKLLRYPDIRLVYWAGGNVFHHHQDINRLIRAWRRPEAVIVHESYWTAHAKFADVVLPATTSLERNDIGSSSNDGFMVAMKQAVPPVGQARDDYDIFAEIADKLGVRDVYTEGRDAMQWLEYLYEESRARANANSVVLPSFADFWKEEVIEYPWPSTEQVMFREYRADPAKAPLCTPSGRIELFSETVAGFGYDEAPGHAFWKPPTEWLGAERAQIYPLHLLSNQPAVRLHSQYDHGIGSGETKIRGREPIVMNPDDAAARGIKAGDVVKVYNDRGAILAGVTTSDGIRPGVVQMATGAWYDPVERGAIGSLDKHGNPNVLTPDARTSRLAQGCAAQSTLVEIEQFDGEPPKVTAFDPPPFVSREHTR
jgi:biotin/methionine sulfoxide reductase